MKKLLASLLLAAFVLALISGAACADSDNFSKYSDKELKQLYESLCEEMAARGLLSEEQITLQEGMYVVGEDIQPGKYKITCTETEGEKMNGAYSALGDAYGKIGDDDGLGSLFGALGDLMEEVSPATVEILGDYGEVLKSYELKAGESANIKLKEGTALKLADGSFILESR